MFRLVGEPDRRQEADRPMGEGARRARVRLVYPGPTFSYHPGFEVAPVAYTSDIPLLGKWGTPLLFGPGSIHVAHTPDEFIDVNELRAAVAAYERIVRSLLAHE